MEEHFERALIDAALIGAAQRVEHYEIAAHGTASEHLEQTRGVAVWYSFPVALTRRIGLLTGAIVEEQIQDEQRRRANIFAAA
jgi:hypothetical protein